MTKEPFSDGGNNSDPSDQSFELTDTIGEDECPSTAVVRLTATATDTSPLDLDPLYDVIDPQNLDELLQNSADSAFQAEMSFMYNGCEVLVTSDEITVRKPGNSDE